MINAVLVFNNSGQPRLTKFYTQLVCFELYYAMATPKQCSLIMSLTSFEGYQRATAPHLRDLHPCFPSPCVSLQLPTVRLFHYLRLGNYLSSPDISLQSPTITCFHNSCPDSQSTPQRYPLPNNIPTLRNPLLHPNIHLHRVTTRTPRPHTSVCRISRSTVRKCVRIRSDFQLRDTACCLRGDDRGRSGS